MGCDYGQFCSIQILLLIFFCSVNVLKNSVLNWVFRVFPKGLTLLQQFFCFSNFIVVTLSSVPVSLFNFSFFFLVLMPLQFAAFFHCDPCSNFLRY